MNEQIWLWVGFNLFVLAMLALDLGVIHRTAHTVSLKESWKSDTLVSFGVVVLILGLSVAVSLLRAKKLTKLQLPGTLG